MPVPFCNIYISSISKKKVDVKSIFTCFILFFFGQQKKIIYYVISPNCQIAKNTYTPKNIRRVS